MLIDEKDCNKTKIFPSLAKCVEYLNSKGLPTNQTTLVRHINKDKAYQGYKFKFI